MADQKVASSVGVERAIAVVRMVLATFSTVTLIGVGAAKPGAEPVEPLVMAMLVLLGASVLYFLAVRWHPRSAGGRVKTKAAVIQGLETVWFVGLAMSLERHVTDAGWALLVVPVVVASLRLDHAAVAATWMLESVTYVVAGPLSGQEPTQQMVERLGVLLAVAACIALLTRWLQEGWREQQSLTSAAEARLQRLAVIESAARAMRAAEAAEVVKTCIAYGPNLGFTAITAAVDGRAFAASGDGEVVADLTPPGEIEPGVVNLTRWAGDEGEAVYSASALEPVSGTIITGWQAEEIDDFLAQALGDLVANTTTALQAATHLEKARFEAGHDPLTGLANRSELNRQLGKLRAGDQPVALLFIDLDRFKEVNDTLGHTVGDGLLVAIGNRLRSAVGTEGLVVRFGGDEFVVLVSGRLANKSQAIGALLGQKLAEPFAVKHHQFTITASIGVAVAREPFDPEGLVRSADEAAYKAKRDGRNAVRTATAPPENAPNDSSGPRQGQVTY